MDPFIAQFENELRLAAQSRGRSLEQVFLEAEADRSNFNKAKNGRIKLEWTTFDALLGEIDPHIQDTLRSQYRVYRERRDALSRRGGPSDKQLLQANTSCADLESYLAERGIPLPGRYDQGNIRTIVDLTIERDRVAGRPQSARRAFYLLAGAIDKLPMPDDQQRANALSSISHLGRYAAFQAGDMGLADAAELQAKRSCGIDADNNLALANLLHMKAKQDDFLMPQERDGRSEPRRLALLQKTVEAMSASERQRDPADVTTLRELIFRGDLLASQAKVIDPKKVDELASRLLDSGNGVNGFGPEQIALIRGRVAQAYLYRGYTEHAISAFREQIADAIRNPVGISNWFLGTRYQFLAEALVQLADHSNKPELLQEAHRSCRAALHYFNEVRNVGFARGTLELDRTIRSKMTRT